MMNINLLLGILLVVIIIIFSNLYGIWFTYLYRKDYISRDEFLPIITLIVSMNFVYVYILYYL